MRGTDRLRMSATRERFGTLDLAFRTTRSTMRCRRRDDPTSPRRGEVERSEGEGAETFPDRPALLPTDLGPARDPLIVAQVGNTRLARGRRWRCRRAAGSSPALTPPPWPSPQGGGNDRAAFGKSCNPSPATLRVSTSPSWRGERRGPARPALSVSPRRVPPVSRTGRWHGPAWCRPCRSPTSGRSSSAWSRGRRGRLRRAGARTPPRSGRWSA